ncbi:NAD(P)-dependent oxidoreductase [Propionibacterium sp.]|uniref:NAD(P)-dependent oxidoreductase n=1 Tax=Propionibacterium sp. TaxID=1977903 RepID=UPI0039E7B634
MAQDVRSVAVLGLGAMGSGMAHRILDAGLKLTVWNRSPQKTEPFQDTAATIAPTPESAVKDADAVITMLFDGNVVREVMTRALPAMTERAIWMQSATVGIQSTKELAAMADQAGVRYVDSPVLGTKQPAATGNLIPLLAGPDDAVSELAPLLAALSKRQVRVGDAAPAGSSLKLAVNAWIATITAGIAQSLTIADRLGVDPSLVLAAIDGTQTNSPYAQLKGREILDDNFDPQFEVLGILKDVRLARAETPEMVDSLLAVLESLYAAASGAGHGKEDIAAVWKTFQH